MDLISEQVYLPSYRRRRNPKTTAAMVVGCAGMVYILQKRYGVLDTAWKTTTRFMMNMVAAWLEDLGGTSLFTPAGMERPEPDPANYFPSRATTQKTVKQPGPSVPGTPRPASLQSSAKDTVKDLDVPEFLMSTKFFACLDLEDSKMVADATIMMELQPHSLLFRAGDDGSEGIFVVVEGSLGMFLHDGEKLVQTNALQPGESVGDLDVIDGARRSITCMALGDGAKLVQLSRSLMFLFLTKRPSALYIYLQQAMSRLWRVANFMLSDYLQLPPPLQCTPCTVLATAPVEATNSVLSDSSTAGLVAPNGGNVGEGVGTFDTNGGTSNAGDNDTHQGRGTSDTTTGESLISTVFSGGQQSEQQGKDPSSAIEMAKALARRAAQVKEYDMLGSDTMEVVKRVLATPPMPTYGGVEWVNHWQDGHAPGSSDAGGAAGVGTDGHIYMDAGAPMQEKGNEMWYYTQQERNAGIMRPVQQLEPRPPVEAFAAAGWDCVNSVEAQLGADTIQKLRQNSITRLMLNIVPKEDIGHMCRIVRLTQGSELLPQGRASWQMLILLEGKVTLERTVRGTPHTALAGPGSILAAASFLCRSTTAESFTAATPCTVLAVGEKELENILGTSPGAYLDVLFAASKALGYIIRRFVSLGLNRVWTRSGDIIYQQGMAADCLYVVISGRVRLVTKNSQNGPVHVEEEVARGQAVGAIWAINNQTHDTSAVAVRDSELVRFSRQSFEVISRSAPEAAAVVLSQMASRLLNARRVRMRASAGKRTPLRPFAPVGTHSGDSFQANFASPETPSDRRTPRNTPNAQSTFVDQKGNIVTIAIVPAGSPPRNLKPNQQRSAVRRLSNALKKGLEEAEGNQCAIITWQMLNVWFPQICEKLQVPFYRTKVTSWMASMEEDYRFIIMEADASEDPTWAQLCVEQADLILLVGTENGTSEVTQAEYDTVWRMLNPPNLPVEAHPVRLSHSGHRMSAGDNSGSKMSSLELAGGGDTVHGACFTADSDDEDGEVAPISKHDWLSFARRTELVLLQEPTCKAPKGTLAWLKKRPGLVRHHQVRLNEIKDVARICRWISGKAVGLVLSGGGSRGLAHLGVLQALDDVGTPVDVIGGTSQGAFMAALYAQGLDKDELQMRVRAYARAMASPRRLLSDITLPVLSVFSGKMFDGHLQETFFDGPQEIEDLWLPYFSVSTNLSTQDVEVHQVGSLWKFVRASMSIVGMLPPVINHGEMLVDGGYLNNIPVDIMHSLGVRHVIVVDVEDKQSGAWHNLTPYDGGLSGWRVLWDRYCPIPSWRSPRIGNISHPRYREMINALSWIAHSQNLRRITQDYKVDLVLSPPYASSFKLMDWHLIDSIVRDAYRYSFGALTAWVEKRQPGLRARGSVAAPGSTKNRRATSFDDSNRHDVSKPWSSVSDMLHHRKQPVKVATAAGVNGERPIRVHVPSLSAAPTPRETQASIPSNPGVVPSITGAIPEASHHQSPSADSLTDASAVPAIGEEVHYKESELMRMTANALELAASHTRQASAGAAEVITTQLSGDGRFPSLSTAVYPQVEQLSAPSWILRDRSFSQPISSSSALPAVATNDEGASSSPATPRMPRQDAATQEQAAVAQSEVTQKGTEAEQAATLLGDESFGGKLADTSRELSEGAMSFKDMLVGASSGQSRAMQEEAAATSASESNPATVPASAQPSKSSELGSPRSPRLDQAIEAAAEVWHPSSTDPGPGEAPDSPSSHSRRRSGRSGSKQLQTISEADNESG